MNKKRIYSLVLAVMTGICLLLTLTACNNGDQESDTKVSDTKESDGCEHAWQDGDVIKEATCTEAGSREQVCTKCNDMRTVELTALGHAFDDAWSMNDDTHFHVCTREGCDEKSDVAEHSVTLGCCDVCDYYDYSCFTEGLTISYSEQLVNLAIPLNSYYVSAYNGTATEVVIPYYYNDGVHGKKPVVAIAAAAFQDKSEITDITVPDSVVFIECRSFEDTAWFGAQSDGVVYVGKVAYTYKGNMPRNYALELKEGTLALSEWAFNSKQNLQSVTLPDSLIRIGRYAFQNCMSLETLTFGNGVETIGGAAFFRCQALTSLNIPASVKVIGERAFADCRALTDVTLGNGVTDIYSEVFKDCGNLNEISFNGTKEEWLAINKKEDWLGRDSITVNCTNGRV